MTDTYLRSGKNLPELFGKHLLLAKLATGGMGEVFLARMHSATGFEKLLVLKRLLPHLNEDPRFVAMFLDEARIAARISHANVCQIYELGNADDQFYMTMEYLEGVSLGTVVERRNLDPKLADMRFLCGLLTQVAEGLHCAHSLENDDGTSAGVVHRDVCLSNIYVTWSGAAKLIDFGVAKARDVVSKTRPGAVKGTYAYMSPEQLRGEEVDARSDIFSLGIVAWETFTGRRLFKRETDYRTFKAITEEPTAKVSKLRPAVPPAISRAVARALSRDADERFQSARDFGSALVEGAASLGPPMLALECGKLMAETFSPVIDRHRARVAALNRIGTEKLKEESTATKEMPIRPHRADSEADRITNRGRRLPLSAPDTSTGAAIGADDSLGESKTLERCTPEPSRTPGDVDGGDVDAGEHDRSGDSCGDLDETGAVVISTAQAPVDGRANRRLVLVLGGLIAVVVVIILIVMSRGGDRSGDRDQAAVDPQRAAPALPGPAGDGAESVTAPPARADSQPASETPAGPKTAIATKAPAPAKKPPPRRVRPRVKKKPKAAATKLSRPRTGQITLQSNPYATIYIDGKKLGYTPIVGHTLSSGAHTLRAVSSANGREQRLTITVTPDKHLRRTLKW